MAAGMPVGAFAASKKLMEQLTTNPPHGHITTFGGNPVIAAASLATLETIEQQKLMEQIDAKEALFRLSYIHYRKATTWPMLAPILDIKILLGEQSNGQRDPLLLLWEKEP